MTRILVILALVCIGALFPLMLMDAAMRESEIAAMQRSGP
jgi:hypothetical protein